LKVCAKSIDDYLQSYSLSAIMSIEDGIRILLARATICDPAPQDLQRTDLQNTSIHSPVKATITFVDPRRKQVDVPLNTCMTFEIFKAFILIYYEVHTENPIRGSEYAKLGDYFLTFENEEISSTDSSLLVGQLWENIVDKRGPLEMGVVMSLIELERGELASAKHLNRCIRCNKSILRGPRSLIERQELVCSHCDLKVTVYPPERMGTFSLDDNGSSSANDRRQNDIDYFTNIRLTFFKLQLSEPRNFIHGYDDGTLECQYIVLNNFLQATQLGPAICHFSDRFNSLGGTWSCRLVVNGQHFWGNGKTKRISREAAALMALQALRA